ncbi:MAG: glycosyltransferase family 39 protein [Candidatus Omnitrophica bacterium]|nr:glycosyltransferase family 39 protein [Candidatus Omnitrophota bacterium]
MKKDVVLILLCFFAVVILFTNLGGTYLWQDEATTAVLGRNTLNFGIPKAFDGKNLILNIYEDPCVDKGWKYAPWLQFYLVAGSFWLLGETTFAARLPFAIFGVGALLLCFLLAERLFKNRLVSRIACAFMAFSSIFFLYMRQARWYPLTTFFTLWLLVSYLDLVKSKKKAILGFVLSAVLLFHSNYGIFFSVFLGLASHFFIFNRSNIKAIGIKKIVFCLFMITILTLPSLLYLGSVEYSGKITFERTEDHLEFYFRSLNKYIFPVGFLFFSLTFFSFFRKKVFPILGKPLDKQNLWLLICVFISTICFLLLADERQLRYLVHLLPIFSIILGVLIVGWLKINKIAAVLLFVIICFTNIFNRGSFSHNKLSIHPVNIVYELTHDYDGPVEGIVKFLNRQAKPTDTVKLIYGDYATIFYTDLRVDNSCFKCKTFPEWIVIRDGWFPLKNLDKDYLREINERYQKIILDYPDIMWENRPDPGYHKFKTVSDWPPVVIYKKK